MPDNAQSGTSWWEAVQAFIPEVMQIPELPNFVKEVNTMLPSMSALRAMRVREPVVRKLEQLNMKTLERPIEGGS